MRSSFSQHIVLCLLLSWCLSVGCSRTAAALPDTREEVVSLLSGYEYVPPAEAFYQLGPGVPDMLSSIAKNPLDSVMLRVRALEALRHYPIHRITQPTAMQVLEEPNQEVVLLRAGLMILADIGHGKAIPNIIPYLSSPDYGLREGAALALAHTHDPSVVTILEKAAARENNDFMRHRILDIVAEMNEQPLDTRGTIQQQSHPEWGFIGPPEKLLPTAP